MILFVTSLSFLILLCLTIYSYGFLDFNLTLSSHPLFLKFIAPLQHLVYFDRPSSAQVYVGIFIFLFLIYCFAVFKYQRSAFPWKLFLPILGILLFSYPMLSYDVFNYMFHGKILWFYHQNPHTVAPQELTSDLWLRFMRWVHTPSAYGPIFTAIESPAYLLGLGKFVPTLYLMKATMISFFAWSIYLVGRIGESLKYSKNTIARAQMILAFNPFLLLELVVNSHNDIVMLALFLFSFYLMIHNKTKQSMLTLALSVGTKYITALTLPMYLIRNRKYKLLFVTLVLYLPILVSPIRFQPWYLIWPIVPATLINTSWSRLWIILTSLAGLVYYIPYVATGFWNNTIPFVSLILYLPFAVSIIYYLVLRNKNTLGE